MPAAFLCLLAIGLAQAQTAPRAYAPSRIQGSLALPVLPPSSGLGGALPAPLIPPSALLPGGVLPASAGLGEAVSAYLRGLPRVDPEAASGLGLHQADDRLTMHDGRSRKERAAFFRRMARRLESVPTGGLDPDEAVDRLLLVAEAWKAAADAEEGPEIAGILAEPLETLSSHFLKEYAPAPLRAWTALSRLEQYPKALRQGRRLEAAPSGPERRAALRDVEGAREFLRGLRRALSRALPDETPRVRRASEAALRELVRFEKHLRGLKLKPRGWARGRAGLERGLSEHGVKAPLPELRARALAEARRTREEIEVLGAGLFPGLDWREAVDAAGGEPLPLKEILLAYRRSAARARRHVQRRGLMTPPKGDSLVILRTPEYLRSMLPEAAYEGPLPLDRTRTGHVFITLPPRDAAPGEVRDWLKSYGTLRAIDLIAVHEADPGHHLQALRQKENKSRVRRILWDVFMGEGWAHYVEGLMADSGFLSGPARLLMLYERYWQAVRARAAIALHAEGWGLERAARYLQRRLRIPRGDARRAAGTYALADPVESMSYALGRLEILRLKEKARRRLGRRFKEREFHDRLLGDGSLPLPHLEAALERDWR